MFINMEGLDMFKSWWKRTEFWNVLVPVKRVKKDNLFNFLERDSSEIPSQQLLSTAWTKENEQKNSQYFENKKTITTQTSTFDTKTNTNTKNKVSWVFMRCGGVFPQLFGFFVFSKLFASICSIQKWNEDFRKNNKNHKWLTKTQTLRMSCAILMMTPALPPPKKYDHEFFFFEEIYKLLISLPFTKMKLANKLEKANKALDIATKEAKTLKTKANLIHIFVYFLCVVWLEQVQKLELQRKILVRNISRLFETAKAELARRDTQLESALRGKPSNFLWWCLLSFFASFSQDQLFLSLQPARKSTQKTKTWLKITTKFIKNIFLQKKASQSIHKQKSTRRRQILQRSSQVQSQQQRHWTWEWKKDLCVGHKRLKFVRNESIFTQKMDCVEVTLCLQSGDSKSQQQILVCLLSNTALKLRQVTTSGTFLTKQNKTKVVSSHLESAMSSQIVGDPKVFEVKEMGTWFGSQEQWFISVFWQHLCLLTFFFVMSTTSSHNSLKVANTSHKQKRPKLIHSWITRLRLWWVKTVQSSLSNEESDELVFELFLRIVFEFERIVLLWCCAWVWQWIRQNEIIADQFLNTKETKINFWNSIHQIL